MKTVKNSSHRWGRTARGSILQPQTWGLFRASVSTHSPTLGAAVPASRILGKADFPWCEGSPALCSPPALLGHFQVLGNTGELCTLNPFSKTPCGVSRVWMVQLSPLQLRRFWFLFYSLHLRWSISWIVWDNSNNNNNSNSDNNNLCFANQAPGMRDVEFQNGEAGTWLFLGFLLGSTPSFLLFQGFFPEQVGKHRDRTALPLGQSQEWPSLSSACTLSTRSNLKPPRVPSELVFLWKFQRNSGPFGAFRSTSCLFSTKRKTPPSSTRQSLFPGLFSLFSALNKGLSHSRGLGVGGGCHHHVCDSNNHFCNKFCAENSSYPRWAQECHLPLLSLQKQKKMLGNYNTSSFLPSFSSFFLFFPLFVFPKVKKNTKQKHFFFLPPLLTSFGFAK